DPMVEPSFMEVKSERAQYWLSVGAQPTPGAAAILKLTGDMGRHLGDKNAESTVKPQEETAEFVPDAKKKPVLKPKSEKPAEKADDAAETEQAEEAATGEQD